MIIWAYPYNCEKVSKCFWFSGKLSEKIVTLVGVK